MEDDWSQTRHYQELLYLGSSLKKCKIDGLGSDQACKLLSDIITLEIHGYYYDGKEGWE
jgi:hypothetical protein